MSAYESVGPSLVVVVVLVLCDYAPGRQYLYAQHQHMVEERVTVWLVAARLPVAEVHQACKQEEAPDDLRVCLHPLGSVGSFAEVSTHSELEYQCYQIHIPVSII